ncbi:MAG TPA: hypothetical protein DHV04_03195, partial [Flavobacteriaceae bacterium]|nr:hypothetical protein [Flavobacteriaceae bacterium]
DKIAQYAGPGMAGPGGPGGPGGPRGPGGPGGPTVLTDPVTPLEVEERVKELKSTLPPLVKERKFPESVSCWF